MAKQVITKEQVKKYNEIVKATIGTDAYDMVALPREYRDDDTKRWIGNPYHYLYSINEYEDSWGAEYYIKNVGGRPYIYIDLDGEASDRLCLDDCEIAKKFFGVRKEN